VNFAGPTLYPDRDELQREYPELEADDIRQARDFDECTLGSGPT
jgi:hypothetical protein